MNAIALASPYEQHADTGIWQRPGYAGIPYSDGEATEANMLALIEQTRDVSSLSSELASQCRDWVTTYHLSGVRANVLRPFASHLQGSILEIGAGCGAITRYLGESGAQVLALEGSLQRARIARERTRDLPNVKLLAENFEHFSTDQRFDVITLIGVLEYAAVFVSGSHPAQGMLKKVRRLLKPGGQLIVAIENQFGLKYFAGAPEDHLGQTAVGLENRYTEQGVRTYGKEALQALLQASGLVHTQFFGAFPDYKLPTTIVSESGLQHPVFDAGAVISQTTKRDLQLPVDLHFSPDLVWPGLVRNGLGMHLANSFIVVASPQTITASPTLAWHISAQRRPEFCKQTVFEAGGVGGGVQVRTQRLTAQAPNTHQLADVINQLDPNPAYEHGATLASQWVKLLLTPGWQTQDFATLLSQYLGLLAAQAGQGGLLQHDVVPGHCFDAVPQNFIQGLNGQLHAIDTEWRLANDLTAGYVLFRALLATVYAVHRIAPCANAPFATPQDWLKIAFDSVNFQLSPQQLAQYVKQEADVQTVITGFEQSPEAVLRYLQTYPIPKTDLTTRYHQLDQTIAGETQKVIDQFERSTSWRLTKPVRWVAKWFKP